MAAQPLLAIVDNLTRPYRPAPIPPAPGPRRGLFVARTLGAAKRATPEGVARATRSSLPLEPSPKPALVV